MNKIVMDRVSCHVTAKCNLRCKMCAVFIPKLYQLGNVPEYDIHDIKNSFNAYFNLVESVRKISLTGGEPLLYPYLAELINFLAEYEEQYDKLEVFTNGATKITEDVLSAMSKLKKSLLFIDHYGPEISKEVENLETACRKFQIPFHTRQYYGHNAHLGGWVDRSTRIEKSDIETAKMQFSKCFSAKRGGRTYVIFGRILTLCASPYCRYRIGEIPLSDVLTIDLGDTGESMEDKMQQLIKIDNVEFNPGCMWCRGLGVYENVERFQPGEQIKGELKWKQREMK